MIKCVHVFLSCSIYKNDHNKWTGVPPSAGRHSWTGVHQFTASIHCIVLVHSIIWVVFPHECFWLRTSCFCQDEYSIFPQTYSIDINGYILVYSVTSNKRFVWTHCRRYYAQCAELCSMLKVLIPRFSSSFEVVQVIHEKLLDMVGKVQWVHPRRRAPKTPGTCVMYGA